MATRLSLRRMGDSTGKLIAAPDSVAELLEKATKKLNPRTSGGGNHRTSVQPPTNRPTL